MRTVYGSELQTDNAENWKANVKFTSIFSLLSLIRFLLAAQKSSQTLKIPSQWASDAGADTLNFVRGVVFLSCLVCISISHFERFQLLLQLKLTDSLFCS